METQWLSAHVSDDSPPFGMLMQPRHFFAGWLSFMPHDSINSLSVGNVVIPPSQLFTVHAVDDVDNDDAAADSRYGSMYVVQTRLTLGDKLIEDERVRFYIDESELFDDNAETIVLDNNIHLVVRFRQISTSGGHGHFYVDYLRIDVPFAYIQEVLQVGVELALENNVRAEHVRAHVAERIAAAFDLVHGAYQEDEQDGEHLIGAPRFAAARRRFSGAKWRAGQRKDKIMRGAKRKVKSAASTGARKTKSGAKTAVAKTKSGAKRATSATKSGAKKAYGKAKTHLRGKTTSQKSTNSASTTAGKHTPPNKPLPPTPKGKAKAADPKSKSSTTATTTKTKQGQQKKTPASASSGRASAKASLGATGGGGGGGGSGITGGGGGVSMGGGGGGAPADTGVATPSVQQDSAPTMSGGGGGMAMPYFLPPPATVVLAPSAGRTDKEHTEDERSTRSPFYLPVVSAHPPRPLQRATTNDGAPTYDDDEEEIEDAPIESALVEAGLGDEMAANALVYTRHAFHALYSEHLERIAQVIRHTAEFSPSRDEYDAYVSDVATALIEWELLLLC